MSVSAFCTKHCRTDARPISRFYSTHDEQVLLGHVVLAEPLMGTSTFVQLLPIQAYRDTHRMKGACLIKDPEVVAAHGKAAVGCKRMSTKLCHVGE